MPDNHGVVVRFSVDTVQASAADIRKITEIIIDLSHHFSADLASRLVVGVIPDDKNLKVNYKLYPRNVINMGEATEPIYCGQVLHYNWRTCPVSGSAGGLAGNIKHQCQNWHRQLGNSLGLLAVEK